ncbi:MAG: hypothetical protein F6K10_05970 [Moorea sp. SIO2B7]|nr:hypothetical protein [Moorena sp. SIO2B7]
MSDNYKADCLQRLDTVDLVESWFELDDDDRRGLHDYLNTAPADQDCPENQQEVEEKLREIEKTVVAEYSVENFVSTLSTYKIAIHFLETRQDLKSEAEAIRESLSAKGISETNIKISGLSQAWFDANGGLSSDQIRYERNSELQAAIALQRILEKAYPKKQFHLQTIRGSSPNYISIFLK